MTSRHFESEHNININILFFFPGNWEVIAFAKPEVFVKKYVRRGFTTRYLLKSNGYNLYKNFGQWHCCVFNQNIQFSKIVTFLLSLGVFINFKIIYSEIRAMIPFSFFQIVGYSYLKDTIGESDVIHLSAWNGVLLPGNIENN